MLHVPQLDIVREEVGLAPVPHVLPSVSPLRTDMQNELHCPACTYGTTGWVEDGRTGTFVVHSIYTAVHRKHLLPHFLWLDLNSVVPKSCISFLHLQNYDKQLMNALSDVNVYACVLVSASVSHSRMFRRTVGGRRLWCVRSLTSFTPSWRRRRGR